MQVMEGRVQPYAWGSTTAVPALLGVEPDGTPQAELWLGAHPAAPALVGGDPLDAVVAADPEGTLGRRSTERFGPALPFLLKVLAAAQPLSLQAHPSMEQAIAGFAAEEEQGVPLGAPHRRYRDARHKPELIVALSPFEALCGFRTLDDATALLGSLGLAAHPCFAGLAGGDWGEVVGGLLRLTGDRRATVGGELGAAVEARGPAWARTIAGAYPGDPGLGVALLLNHLELTPGMGIFLPPGQLHAYLCGTGIEVMASSDNVLRGGLTPKFVDVDELLSVLDLAPSLPQTMVASAEGRSRRYPAPVGEFALTMLEAGPGTHTSPGGAPRVVLCLEGAVDLAAGRASLTLAQGRSAWVPASDPPLVVGGPGRAAVVTVP